MEYWYTIYPVGADNEVLGIGVLIRDDHVGDAVAALWEHYQLRMKHAEIFGIGGRGQVDDPLLEWSPGQPITDTDALVQGTTEHEVHSDCRNASPRAGFSPMHIHCGR